MDGIALGMLAFEHGLVHVQGVDAHGLHPGVQDELRRPAVQKRVIVVVWRTVAVLPAGTDDGHDALRQPGFVRVEILDRDPLPRPLAAHVHHDRRADEHPEVHLVYARPVLDEVVGGVDVGAGVAAYVDLQHVHAVRGDGRGRR